MGGVANVRFERADAERLTFSRESFDFVLCSSALVLMSDIRFALRHWCGFLKPGGVLAFDTPAKPFGISDKVVRASARHGVHLAYGEVADSPDKCCDLLSATGLDVVSIRRVLVASDLLPVERAISLYDDRLDHPAWRGIRESSGATQAAIRADFIKSAMAESVDGHIADDMTLNFTVGRKPA